MDFADLFHRITLSIMQAGMPAVHAYHLISGNIFLNVEAEEATGLEKIANVTLTPVHYLLAGNVAVLDPETHTYQLVQKHDYREFFMLKTAASIAALPFSLIVGSVLKGAAFCFSETRHRHKAILASIASTDIRSNLDYYRFIGLHLPEVEEIEAIAPPSYFRRPGDEKVLSKEKEALKEVAQILREKKIPFWIDCGTCLGAYRYGGVIPWDFDIDMAVLEKDFDNVKHALNALDRKK